MGKFDDTDDDVGFRPDPDDPYAPWVELFADCRTPAEVLQLMREIDAAEADVQ